MMYTATIIGVSGFGNVHFNDLTQCYPDGSMKIIGATVINQDQEMEKCAYLRSRGCEMFTDYRQMFAKLKNKIDICYIPTGIGMHKAMTIAALNAGANVFVEKPLCGTVQDVAQMKQAEERNGKFVIVGYQHIMQPAIMELKRILLSGQLGQVRRLKTKRYSCVPKSYYFRNSWAGKICSPDGTWILDSPYNNSAAHELNLLLFLAGRSFETSAQLESIQAELYRSRDYTENADTGFMRIKTTDSTEIFYATSLSCDCNGLTINLEIECKNGSLKLENNLYVVTYHNGGREMFSAVNSRHAITRAVCNKLADPNSFACGIDIAAVQTLAINGAHESSDILEIPAAFTETVRQDQDKEATVIKDLKKIMADCYENARLPGELDDVPWAHQGEIVYLTDYQEFIGGKTGVVIGGDCSV